VIRRLIEPSRELFLGQWGNRNGAIDFVDQGKSHFAALGVS